VEGGKEVRREGGGQTHNLLEGDVANNPPIDAVQNIPHLNTLTKHGIMVMRECTCAHTMCVYTQKRRTRREGHYKNIAVLDRRAVAEDRCHHDFVLRISYQHHAGNLQSVPIIRVTFWCGGLLRPHASRDRISVVSCCGPVYWRRGSSRGMFTPLPPC
jgi:hypothetical protein